MASPKRASKISKEINVTLATYGSSLVLAKKLETSKDQTLDLLGAELLKSAALRDDEIEAIAAGGELFANVRARIIADSVIRKSTPFRFALVHKMAIASAAAAVIVVSMFAAMYTSDKPPAKPQISKVQPESPRVSDQPAPDRPTAPIQISSGDNKFVEVHPPSRPHYERAIEYRSMPETKHSTQISYVQDQDTPGEFYALADLHPSEEATRNGRIIRVELPRASLVALGVNLPLDSDKQMIKTDLLVGPDGVPRAIRLVD